MANDTDEEVVIEQEDIETEYESVEDAFSDNKLEYIPNSGMDGPSDSYLCEECKQLGYCKKKLWKEEE